MEIIGSKLLEVIKLKQALVLILFASLLFPQSNINQIIHPLDDKSPALRDKDKSYIVINSDSHFEIPNMLNQFDNSILYQSKLNDYNINLSYKNHHADINSDTVSALFKLGLRQKYHSYKIDLSRKYNKWNAGAGYSINQGNDLFHNYNFYLNRRIFRYFRLEYRYGVETKPAEFDLQYEDFNYLAVNNQNNQSSTILFSFKKNRVKNNIQYERLTYSNKVDNDFDSFEGGKSKIYMDLSGRSGKKLDFYLEYENSLDTMMMDLIKNEGIFYKINIFKVRSQNYLVKFDYKLESGRLNLGYGHKDYKYELSSRINVQDISDNLVERFTVPIINGLDTIKVVQDNLFLFYERKFEHSKYKIGLNFSKNSLYYYHRAGTPPLNPLIPIFVIQKGDYTLNMVNLILNYSFIINKFHIDILLDNMSPLSVINEIDDSKGSMIDDLPSGKRFIMFNQLSLSLSYPLN